MPAKNKTIAELNEDCEILIRKEIEKRLINYASPNEKTGTFEVDDQNSGFSMASQPEMQQLYFSPINTAVVLKERLPKMLSSNSANGSTALAVRPKDSKFRRCVDAPIQATDEKYANIPRSTLLSRTRQHLSKRHSGAQSQEIKYRSVKTQTENCCRHNISISVDPIDFIGVFEKSTNVPLHNKPGMTKSQGTQMYDHITQSELFCIEWIHKNLFEVKLSPNTLVVDDKLRDHSESACVT